MNWMEQDEPGWLNCNSDAVTEKQLAEDIKIVLERLSSDRIVDTDALLVYADATNGVLYFSGYDHNTGEAQQDTGIRMYIPAFWDDNPDAYDFDEQVLGALKVAWLPVTGTFVYYQTEQEEAIQL